MQKNTKLRSIFATLLCFVMIFSMLNIPVIVNAIENDIMPMVFVTGNIPADMFEINGLPEDVNTTDFLSGWSYVADGKPINQVPMKPDGTTPATRFPEYAGYHFVNVTIDNVVATQLGVLQLSEFLGARGTRYYYLTTTAGNEYETSSTILEDGQKFTINYAIDEYTIDYEVKMSNDDNLPSGFDLDTVFGVGRPYSTTNGSYSFDVRIQYGYTARVYRYWTDNNGIEQFIELTGENHPEHNNGYPLGTEPVYVKVDNRNVKVDESQGPKTMLVNDTFYDDNVTEDIRIVVELTKSNAPVFNASQWLHTEYTGGHNDTTQRGSTAEEDFVWEDHYNNGNITNIIPENNTWNWGSVREGEKTMTKNSNGTYDFTWTFQTNTGYGGGLDGFFLDTLEVNGLDLVVPFFPRVAPESGLKGFNPENGKGIGEVEGKSYTITTLEDGTQIRLDYLYVFCANGTSNQRIYRLTVTNATCNVTISGGNLMMYGEGSPEFVTYSLVGVHADGEGSPNNRAKQHPAIQAYWGNAGWKDHPMSNVVIDFPYQGDPNHFGATMRFKLADGYSNPYYSFESTRNGVINDLSGKPQTSIGNEILPLPINGNMDSQHIYGPDADGWYYINVTTQGLENPVGSDNYHKMALLYITATPIEYVVEYLPGEVENAETMPEYTHSNSNWNNVNNNEHYDDNGDNHYDVVTNNVITIDGRIPTDPEQQSTITGKVFKYWTLVSNERNADGTYKVINENIRIYPGQAFSLEGIFTEIVDKGGYSTLNPELNDFDVDMRVLRLQAVWEPTPDKFSYTVYIEYVDDDGILQRVEVPADVVDTENDYHAGEKLIVGVNLDAPVFVNWLKDHPYYHFAANNKDVHEIDDKDEIIITFERKNGGLILEKHVYGDSGDNDTFTFTINGPKHLNENFLAWPMDIPIDQRTENDMIVIHFENGVAHVQLKDGERIVLYIPVGEYTITEEKIDNIEYIVNIDETFIEDGKPAQTTKTVLPDQDTQIIYKNIFSNSPFTGDLTITKKVTGGFGNKVLDFMFTINLENKYTSLPKTIQVNKNGIIEDVEIIDGKIIVYMRHDDVITLMNLPIGTTYTIIESNEQYEVNVTKIIDGEDVTINSNTITGTIYDSQSIVYENSLQGIVPVGVSIPTYYLGLVFVIMSLVGFIVINKHRNKYILK